MLFDTIFLHFFRICSNKALGISVFFSNLCYFFNVYNSNLHLKPEISVFFYKFFVFIVDICAQLCYYNIVCKVVNCVVPTATYNLIPIQGGYYNAKETQHASF